jgi:hypothetical protein
MLVHMVIPLASTRNDLLFAEFMAYRLEFYNGEEQEVAV